MKKRIKEIVILLLQIFMFYVFPLFASPTDMIGLVVLILFSTFILSIVVGAILNYNLKYLYPIIVVILFLPTIFIYYNDSALIHSIWYLVDSFIGLIIGVGINKFLNISKGGN